MRYTTIFTLLLVVIFLFSCQENEHPEMLQQELGDLQEKQLEMELIRETQGLRAPATQKVSDPQTPKLTPKLIRTAFLKIESDNAQKALGQITQLTDRLEGYVSKQVVNNYASYIRVNLSLRIPSKQFDPFLLSLDSANYHFTEKKLDVKDVGEEFLDLEIRRDNLLAMAKRYRQLLSKANNVDEMLQVERELQKTAAEIEKAKGRLSYLSNRISYSTLNIEITQEIEQEKKENKGPSFFSDAADSLSAGWDGVKFLFLLLLTIWPVWVVGLATFFLIRYSRRNRREES
ncbi:MAG: DUF4349 domain-containing protein [Bacteroidota bacterium]